MTRVEPRSSRAAPLERTPRWGLCCAFVNEPIMFRTTTAAYLARLPPKARVSFLRDEIKPETLKEQAKKVVAKEAVFDRNGAKAVYVVDAGKLQAVNVTTGAAVGSSLELVDGPTVGTRVVRNPTGENFDGQRIKEGE